MIRRIIEINEEKCNGCGLCAEACHEGAIGMVNGKARLLRDDYCDGLGAFLPVLQTRSASWNGKPLHTMPRRSGPIRNTKIQPPCPAAARARRQES